MLRTKESKIINGETAIKPYYYMRNGLLHVRYMVDRCIELSPEETQKIKDNLAAGCSDKQSIFSNMWNRLTKDNRTIILDGIVECTKRMKKLSNRFVPLEGGML